VVLCVLALRGRRRRWRLVSVGPLGWLVLARYADDGEAGEHGQSDETEDESAGVVPALPGHLARQQGESKFSSWLYRICYNTCISELRKKRPEVELDEAMGVPVEGPVQDFRNRDIQATIQEEVSKLPDDYRAALTLYHFNGLSYEEIAKLTRKPMGTVKAHIHRARAVLKTRLLERVGWDNLKEVMWQ
jgi:RNA polymerase sigma-70 factor (ECF subfamily)